MRVTVGHSTVAICSAHSCAVTWPKDKQDILLNMEMDRCSRRLFAQTTNMATNILHCVLVIIFKRFNIEREENIVKQHN